MALSPSLQQFKSSGVYRLEFDRSQIINIPAETIRLVIGFSKKGPFNTPVFVQDSVFFKTVFGDIDTALERKGSFFHRTALTCLTRGPIIVLNLLILEETDTSQFQSVSTSASIINEGATAAPISEFYNTDKFWFLDPSSFIDYLHTIQSDDYINDRKLLNLGNVGRKTISVITKKSDVLGFNVLAKDWFGAGKVPDFMNENDYIIDYMIDVIVVEGDFSNYTALSIDPIFGPYFDSTGLKKTTFDTFGLPQDGLTSFLNLDQVNVLGVYTGALIPEFQDKNGSNLFIQDLVNLESSKTGLMVAFDGEKLDDDPSEISGNLIDLVGHTLESEEPTTLDFLSYYGPIISEFEFPGSTGALTFVMAGTAGQTANCLGIAGAGITGGTAWTTGRFDTLRIFGPSYSGMTGGEFSAFATQSSYLQFLSDIQENSSYIQCTSYPTGASAGINFSHVISESANTLGNYVDLVISKVANGVSGPTAIANSYLFIDGTGVTAGGTTSVGLIKSINFNFAQGGNLFVGVDNDLYQDNLSGIITDGDRIDITGATNWNYVEFNRVNTNVFTGATFSSPAAFGAFSPILSQETNYLEVNAYENVDLTTGATSISAQNDYRFLTLNGDINESFELWGGTAYNNPTTTVWVDNSSSGPLGASGFNGQILVGQYLAQNFGGTGTPTDISPVTGKSRLTRIISVAQDTNPLSATYQKIKIVTNDPIYIRSSNPGVYEIERYKSITDFVTHYRFQTMGGYTLNANQVPDGTLTRQNEILDVLNDTNLGAALADREVITFRYIVDSFEGGIEPSTKIRLTSLAKNRQSVLAICNMPSVKQFKDSTNPLFKLNGTSNFDARYIAEGGNLSLNPTNVFSLPGIADGANYSAFYGPYLVLREGGRNINIPPAAHVSNLYIDKYNLALPYSIVAGPRRGVVTGTGLVGVEYNFDRNDLDSIEPFGYNSILNKRGFGLVINSNQTAQQNIKSALSQIHVRELLIYVQDGIEAILKNYRWEFNTAQNRLEIKTLADNFMTQILSDGGVYDYQNIMDTTNNTPEIIDSNIGILDTYLEPVRGMGILVHRTTILKTGTIATGNFL